MIKFFIAGIIQGSIPEKEIHQQDYRIVIKNVLAEHFPNDEVFCPFENHPNSINYSFEDGRATFFELMGRASKSDVLVAYLPEASMGTAIEMWEAYQNNKTVVCISPLKGNWAVKFLSDIVLDCLEGFVEFVESGKLAKMLTEGIAHEPF